MTPKLKAKKLLEKFLPHVFHSVKFWEKQKAKKCALILIDEIISICPYQDYKDTLCPYDGAELSVDYWNEVKSELEKL